MMDQGNSSGSPTAEKVTEQKMNAALKAKWVEALRNGKFKQGRFALEECGSFCCLGVLVSVQGVDLPEWPSEDRETAVIPKPYRGGLSVDLMIQLGDRNDSGEPFCDIADYIEQNL